MATQVGCVVVPVGHRIDHVDVRRGQKTGFFLDQRENRLALRRYSGASS